MTFIFWFPIKSSGKRGVRSGRVRWSEESSRWEKKEKKGGGNHFPLSKGLVALPLDVGTLDSTRIDDEEIVKSGVGEYLWYSVGRYKRYNPFLYLRYIFRHFCQVKSIQVSKRYTRYSPLMYLHLYLRCISKAASPTLVKSHHSRCYNTS